MGGISNASGPSPTLRSLGPFHTSRETIFYDNFMSTWMRHSKHSCHIGPFSCHIGHFLSFWTVFQKTMFSTSITNSAISLECHSGVPLVPMMSQALLKERCATKGEDHFHIVHHNITNEEFEARFNKYIKFGTPFAKNKVVTTSKNILERCLCYLYFKMQKHLNSFLARVLLQMCCS